MTPDWFTAAYTIARLNDPDSMINTTVYHQRIEGGKLEFVRYARYGAAISFCNSSRRILRVTIVAIAASPKRETFPTLDGTVFAQATCMSIAY